MNRNGNFKVLVKITFCFLLILATSCSRDRNHPGYEYFDDMARSEAYEYYSENPNFKDGKTAQAPVKGSIARGEIPYPYPLSPEGQEQAGRELVNTVGYAQKDLRIGKEKFMKFCAMCHGQFGKGDGFLVTSKKFIKDIPPLGGDFVQRKPDGELFHVITKGSVSGFMGSHSWQLEPDDRWRIVSFIKHDLKSN